MSPDLRPYLVLLGAFVAGRLSPSELQAILIPLFKGDQLIRPPATYELLNEAFLATEAWDPEMVRSGSYGVSEDELYDVARRVLNQLEDIADRG